MRGTVVDAVQPRRDRRAVDRTLARARDLFEVRGEEPLVRVTCLLGSPLGWRSGVVVDESSRETRQTEGFEAQERRAGTERRVPALRDVLVRDVESGVMHTGVWVLDCAERQHAIRVHAHVGRVCQINGVTELA
jgi:hypothetical protein